MKYKILVLGIIIVALTTQVHGYLADKQKSYYTFDSGNTSSGKALDVVDGNDLKINGATTGQTGKIEEAYSFDGVDDKLQNLSYTGFKNVNSISAWFKTDDSDAFQSIIYLGSGSSDRFIIQMDNTGNQLKVFNDINGASENIKTNVNVSDGNWHHVVVTLNAGGNNLDRLKIFIDGNNVKNATVTEQLDQLTNEFHVGATAANGNNWNGSIDEIAFWSSRALDQKAVNTLYNNNNGLQYNYGKPQLTNITIQPANPQQNNTITANTTYTTDQALKANISGQWFLNGNSKKNESFTNVANNTEIQASFHCPTYNCSDADTVNITFNATNKGNINNISTTVSIQNLGEIRIANATEKITNNTINTYNTTSPQTAQTTNGTLILKNVDVGNRTLTANANASNYLNTITKTINVNFNQTTTTTLTGFYNHNLTVNASEVLSNGRVTNYTATIDSLNNSFSTNKSTTNGQTVFKLLKRFHYNLSIPIAPGFATIFNNNQSLIMQKIHIPTSSQEVQTFDAYTRNTFNATILNITDQSKIQKNSTITFEFGPQDYTFQTQNGSIFETQILTGTYDITVGATTFSDVQQRLTVLNNSLVEQTYLLEKNSQIVLFQVQDGLGNPVKNATAQFETKVNGTQVTITQLTTDFSGEFQADLNPTRRYTVTVQAPGFETFQGTVKPNNGPYTIDLSLKGQQEFITPFNGTSFTTNFNQFQNNTKANHTFKVVTAENKIERYNYTLKHDQQTFTETASQVTGGTLQTQFNVSPTTREPVNVTYEVKLLTGETTTFQRSYTVTNPQGATLTGGLFKNVQLGTGGKAVLAYIIITAITILSIGATGSPTFGMITSMSVTGALATAGLLITTLTAVTLLIEGIILIEITRRQV